MTRSVSASAVTRGRARLAAGVNVTELLRGFREDDGLTPLLSITALRELAPLSLDAATTLVFRAREGASFDHLGAAELRQVADIPPGILASSLFEAIVSRRPWLLFVPPRDTKDVSSVRVVASTEPDPSLEGAGSWGRGPLAAIANEVRLEARRPWWSGQIEIVRDEPDALLIRFPRVGAPRFEPPEIREVAPEDAVFVALTQRYFEELRARFGAFEAPTAESLAYDARSACALVAFDHLGPMGCATLRRLDPLTAEVKRMFVHPRARGRRVGEAMLVALEDAARARGCSRLVLDTHASLVEAARLYRRAGYRECERYNDNPYAAVWFDKRL